MASTESDDDYLIPVQSYASKSKRMVADAYKDAIECPWCGQFYRVISEGIICCQACGGPPDKLPSESPQHYIYQAQPTATIWATTSMVFGDTDGWVGHPVGSTR